MSVVATHDAAIVAVDLAKVYRRHSQRNQFKTLKSALLTGSVLSDLAPGRDLHGARERLLRSAARLDLRRDRRERLGQEHAAQARRRDHQADARQPQRRAGASRP